MSKLLCLHFILKLLAQTNIYNVNYYFQPFEYHITHEYVVKNLGEFYKYDCSY